MAESGIPWTTLRATQFHDLMLLTAREMAKLPVIPAPSGFQAQPVDATRSGQGSRTGARAACRAGGDLGGPRVYRLADLIRGYLRARVKHRAIAPVRVPGKAARAKREGAKLAADRAVGRRTWEEFLAART